MHLSLRLDGCWLANFCHFRDPQLSFGIFWQCASFCKLVHIAQLIPPTPSVLDLLASFDSDMLYCHEQWAELQPSPMASWQAQLSLRHEGFGLSRLFSHATASYISLVRSYL